MFKRFFPMEYVENVNVIDYTRLKENGIKGLIFDLDNTLAPFDVKKPTEKIKVFLNQLETQGFKICLVSNNQGKRVEIYNEELKLPTVSKAGKPRKRGILTALKLMNISKEEGVVIGDQMFTDIWVSNRIGMYSILVKPIGDRDEFTVRLKRGLEKKVFNMYMKKIKYIH